MAELLGDGVQDVESVTSTASQRVATAHASADLFLTYYRPTYAAAARLDEEGRTALRDDLVSLTEAFARGPAPASPSTASTASSRQPAADATTTTKPKEESS